MNCGEVFAALVFVLFFFGIYHKLYKRSVSTFIIISSLFAFTALHETHEKLSWAIMCLGILIVYARAIFKPDNDKVKAW